MIRSAVVVALAALLLCTLGAGLAVCDAAEVTVTSPAGESVPWSEWVRDHGPAAVVLWASWAPGAEGVLAGLDDLAEVAADKGLAPVLVALQEPLEEAADGLEGVRVEWFHDRHGALLKQYRVVSVPALVVLDPDGRVVIRLEPTAASLGSWKGQ